MDYGNTSGEERRRLNREWLPRLTVDDVDGYIDGGNRRSAAARRRLTCHLDVPYGDTPRQVLDVF